MRAYRALRRRGNRPLQSALASLGLSSPVRSEGHVLATLGQVIEVVVGSATRDAEKPHALRGEDRMAPRSVSDGVSSMPSVAQLTPVVLVSAVLLSGCGGEPRRAAVTVTVPAPTSSGVTVPETSGTARVTDPARMAYIRAADRVCGTLDPEREAKLREVKSAPSPVDAYAATVALAGEQLRRIAAIPPPPADRSLIARNVVDRLHARLIARQYLQRDLAAGDDSAAARDQAQFEALGVAVRSFARGYGFRKCGTP